jgi:hypothetical protein
MEVSSPPDGGGREMRAVSRIGIVDMLVGIIKGFLRWL